ncbi:DUF7344 domain-containing protein [Halalkalicoccus jeotgali]|nr:hypothetical protein [Halalkalicoccus jeotgali]
MSVESLTRDRSIETHELPVRAGERLSAFVRSERRLEKEEVFDLLYNPRRRATLRLVAQRSRPLTMEDLVDRIAAAENDVPVDKLERQQRRRVHVSLYQTHLPLLDEVGAIEYDRERTEITPGACLAELLPYLDVADATRSAWRTYYRRLLLGYAVFGAIVLVGASSSLPLATLALSATALFLVLACLHGLD